MWQHHLTNQQSFSVSDTVILELCRLYIKMVAHTLCMLSATNQIMEGIMHCPPGHGRSEPELHICELRLCELHLCELHLWLQSV